MLKKYMSLMVLGCSMLMLASCQSEPTGSLEFRANGEDFVRAGFVSKDGWEISFDHVYVNLSDVVAYQTDPPYNAADGGKPVGTEALLAGESWVDLAEGDDSADPILVGTAADLGIGQFNAISWNMPPASSGLSLQIVGTAVRNGREVNFDLSSTETYGYSCGEFVGDERKGFISEDGTAEIEMTFHFDHVFGDIDTPADDALNVGAVGFDPLAEIAEYGELTMTIQDLSAELGAEDFAKLTKTLQTLGHVGEGHCFELTGGYTGKE